VHLTRAEWLKQVNQELEDIRVADEGIRHINPDGTEDLKKYKKGLKDKYSKIKLTWIKDYRDNKIKWAFEVVPISSEPEPEKIPTWKDKLKENFLSLSKVSYYFVAIISLWFWVYWFSHAILLGTVVVGALAAYFVFFWPACFGFSYLGRFLFDDASHYLRNK